MLLYIIENGLVGRLFFAEDEFLSDICIIQSGSVRPWPVPCDIQPAILESDWILTFFNASPLYEL